MTMQETRRVLSVFLASPGDVLQERDTAVEVVHRFNKSVAPRLGWSIDLHRWEDNSPAYGRPQSIINPAVDNCDLFIGLLWERWGQPTGIYSSGFHEEFERVRNRRKSTGQPEIWLVFKTPRSDKLEDPGSELKKVLEFREEQKSLREVLFRDIQNLDDWKMSLHDWLFNHIWGLASPAVSAQRPPTESPPGIGSEVLTSSTSNMEEQGSEETLRQLAELATKLSRTIASGNLELSLADATILDEFDIARLYLLAETWMARRYNSDFLGTHEINLLYKHRDKLIAANAEEDQILRTLLHDTADVIPGWYWFRQAFPDGPLAMLLGLANDDTNMQVRVQALKALTAARVDIPKEDWPLLPLSDEPAVSAEALRYLGALADDSALDLVDEAAQSTVSRVSNAAREARLSILRRLNPRQGFAELVSSEQFVSDDLIRAFNEVISQAATEDLIKGTKEPGDLRTISIKELTRRGDLTIELAETLRDDPSLEVRQPAIQKIVNERGEDELSKLRSAQKPDPWSVLSGRKNLDLDLIAFNYYRTIPVDKLIEKVDWLSLEGANAYKALAVEHYQTLSEFIRTDLENGFTRIREKWLKDLESRVGPEAAERLSQKVDEKLDDFIRSEYTESALSGLARHAQPSDVQIGRKYLTDSNPAIQLAAAEIVSKFGDDQDVQTLLNISEKAWGRLEKLATEAAIRLSRGPLQLALEMAISGNARKAKIANQWLKNQDSSEIRNYFRSLLDDEGESRRAVGVSYLARKLDETQMRELLDEYLGKQTYYYNVVTWVGRLLYAPSPLKEMFTRDLNQQASRYLSE
jgi:hypothetical protein